MATFSFAVIAALLAVLSAGVLGKEPDGNLASTNADQRDHCIIVIGELKLVSGAQRIFYEYYHPDADVVCDVKPLPLSWKTNIDPEYHLTCGLSATKQVVTYDADAYLHHVSIRAAVYSVLNRTVRFLPDTVDEGFIRTENKGAQRVVGFMTFTGISQCIACSRWKLNGWSGERPLKCWKYDARKTQPIWEPIPGAAAWEPVSRRGNTAAWLTENDLYVITEDPELMAVAFRDVEHKRRVVQDVTGKHNTLYRYNMSTGRLDQKQSAPGIRLPGYGATALSSTELLLCGGMALNGPAVRECDIYDTTKGRWYATGRMNVGRTGHSLITFNGEVYAIAGWTQDFAEELLSVERYNRTDGMWTLVKPLKEAKRRALPIVV